MLDTQIQAQYSTGLSRPNIERALIAAGKDLDRFEAADLGMLEDFHTMGRIATSRLVDSGSPATTACSAPAAGSAVPPATPPTGAAAPRRRST